MQDLDFRNFVETSKQKYFMIHHVICPALDFKKVYFDRSGFNHLLKKGRIARSEEQQRRRLSLITESVDIISTSISIKAYNKSDCKIPNAEFWSMEKVIGERIVRVVVRKIGETGQTHFFSVMDKRL